MTAQVAPRGETPCRDARPIGPPLASGSPDA